MSYKRRSPRKAIIKSLRTVGGVASRDKIKALIADDETNSFSHSDVFDSITSRNGNQYVPFNFDFNFALQELAVIGYVEALHRGADIVLTEKGRTVDLAIHPDTAEERQWSEYWENKNKLRLATKKANDSGLKSDDITLLADDTVAVEEQWQVQLLAQLKSFSPTKFESFARLLISKMGVSIDKQKGIVATGDHGIDGYGYFESDEFRTSRVAIQAKRYTDQAISEPLIDNFKGAMDSFNAEYGIFITTTYFTETAKQKAIQGNRTVTLIDGQRIVELVERYQLHVTPVQTFALDDYYFEQD